VTSWHFRLVETGLVPDWVTQAAVRVWLKRSNAAKYRVPVEQRRQAKRLLIRHLRESPIAIRPMEPNRQHYEVPTTFFQLVLGRRLKYSCCYWPSGVQTLDQAEDAMLQLTCDRAQVQDGMRVLDLGCGWGSLALWIVEHYPNCRVTAISNSQTQVDHIREQSRLLGLTSVEAVRADANDFHPQGQFDRVLSVEMFEHMKNYERLMGRISTWLRPEGLLFVHAFCHREFAYEFETVDPRNWMARTFFTGGTMPSDDLLLHFQRDLNLVDHWSLDGWHYARTLREWRQQLDANRQQVRRVLKDAFGAEQATRCLTNWRLFFIACEAIWGLDRGKEYLVSHYLFQPQGARQRFDA